MSQDANDNFDKQEDEIQEDFNPPEAIFMGDDCIIIKRKLTDSSEEFYTTNLNINKL